MRLLGLLSKKSGPVVKNYDLLTSLPAGVTLARASTGTRFNDSGVLVTEATDVARFDHDPATLAPLGLMLEPAATNLCLQSEDFTNASWVKSLGTVSGNTTTSPDGAATADTLTLHAASFDLYQAFTGLTPGAAYTISFWAKLGTATNFVVAVNDSTSWDTLYGLSKEFTAADGLNTSTLKRVSMTVTIPANGKLNIHLGGHGKSTADVAQQTAGTVILWGFQLELGTVATSYMKTTTVPVTRAADALTLPVADGSYAVTQADAAGSRTVYRVATSGILSSRVTRTNSYRIQSLRLVKTAATSLESDAIAYANDVMALTGNEISDADYARVSALITALKSVAYDGTTLYARTAVVPMLPSQNAHKSKAPLHVAKIGGLKGSVSTSLIAGAGEFSVGSRGLRYRKAASGAYDEFRFITAFNSGRERNIGFAYDAESSPANARTTWAIGGTVFGLRGETINTNLAYNLANASGIPSNFESRGDVNVPSFLGVSLGAGDNAVRVWNRKTSSFTSGTSTQAAGSVTFAFCAPFGNSEWGNIPALFMVEGPGSAAIMNAVGDAITNTLLNSAIGAATIVLGDGQSNLTSTLFGKLGTAMATAFPGSGRVGPAYSTGGTVFTAWVSGTNSGNFALTTTGLSGGTGGQGVIDGQKSYLSSISSEKAHIALLFMKGEADSEFSLADATSFGDRFLYMLGQYRTQIPYPTMDAFLPLVHYSLDATQWGDPNNPIFTQQRRDWVEFQRDSARDADSDARVRIFDTYGYARKMDDPGDPMYLAGDNVHNNSATETAIANLIARFEVLVDVLAVQARAVRRWSDAVIAADHPFTIADITAVNDFYQGMVTASLWTRCVRIVNDLYSTTRARKADLISGKQLAALTSTGKITCYLRDTVSLGERSTITTLLNTLTGSANVEALQHRLSVSGAGTAAANGTYYLKSSHTTPTGGIAYVGTVWVKSGDDDCVISGPDCTRAGVQQTSWKVEKHGTGVLYTHPSTYGTVRPPEVTPWSVGAAGSSSAPTVTETFA